MWGRYLRACTQGWWALWLLCALSASVLPTAHDKHTHEWPCEIPTQPRPPIASGLPWVHDAFVTEYGSLALDREPVVDPNALQAPTRPSKPLLFIVSHLISVCSEMCTKERNERRNSTRLQTCSQERRALTSNEIAKWMRTSAPCHGLSTGTCYSPSFACVWQDGSITVPEAVSGHLLSASHRSVVYSTCDVPSNMTKDLAAAGPTTRFKVVLRPYTDRMGLSLNRASAIHIPVCHASALVTNADARYRVIAPAPAPAARERAAAQERRRYTLSACVWTKAIYRNRFGKLISDGAARLPEWLTYHILMGVDHFYIYDNYDAKAEGERSLLPLLDFFIKAGYVTYIPWPSQSCHLKYRSSQYAATNSCLRRFGSQSAWMAHIDVDDFLIPMGKHASLVSILEEEETASDVDAIYFDMVYCAPCRHEPNRETTTRASRFQWLANCSCAGKFLPEKFKGIVRPERVLFQLVHYAVTGTRTKRVNSRILDMQSEGKYVHLRTGFGFESDAAALVPGFDRFGRLLEGHRHACNSSKPMWCFMPEIARLLGALETEQRTRELIGLVSCAAMRSGEPDPFPGACGVISELN